MQVLAYLKGTLHHGLFYNTQARSNMYYYVDVDYGNCPDTRRSISGYCVFMGAYLIS